MRISFKVKTVVMSEVNRALYSFCFVILMGLWTPHKLQTTVCHTVSWSDLYWRGAENGDQLTWMEIQPNQIPQLNEATKDVLTAYHRLSARQSKMPYRSMINGYHVNSMEGISNYAINNNEGANEAG